MFWAASTGTLERLAKAEQRMESHEKTCGERQSAILGKFDDQIKAREEMKAAIGVDNAETLAAVRELHGRISKTNDRMYVLVATALIGLITMLVSIAAYYIVRYGIVPPGKP